MQKKSVRIFALLLASALVVLSSSCSTKVNLTEYESQDISWNVCDSELLTVDRPSKIFTSAKIECASMLVPAIYEGLDKGKDFEIPMMRLHKAADSDFMGSIFINPGGPGASGIEQLQFSDFPEELVSHFDIIGFDPRGVGASKFSDGSFVKCSDTLDLASYFQGEMSPSSFEEYEYNIPASDVYISDCVQKNPLWWTLSTDHVVDDLELMRKVVTGDQSLNFIGTSYGTTIAGLYVTKYPKHVGKIVLDSPTTVDSDPTKSAIEDAKAMESKLTIYLNGYAKHAGISFEEALQRLLKFRQEADDDELIGFAGIFESEVEPGYTISSEALLVRGILALNYMPEQRAVKEFNTAMDDLEKYNWNGNFEWYGLHLDGYAPESLKGLTLAEKKLVRSNSYEIMAIVNSMDYSPAESSASEQKALARQLKAAAPMWTKLKSDASGYEYYGPSLGLNWARIANENPFIPDPPKAPLVRANNSGKQLLIVGSLYESVTPITFAKDTAKLLKSPLISVESDEHGPAAGYDISCLNKVLFQYFVEQTEVKSQTCSK